MYESSRNDDTKTNEKASLTIQKAVEHICKREESSDTI